MQEIRTERPNLFEPDDYITFYLELGGSISPKALADAIKAAFLANESTMSKIVLTPDGNAYYEKMAESGCKIEILEDNWQHVIKVNEKLPFALERGELVRNFILPKEDKLSLVIMAHHLAGDGKAVLSFIECIMAALSGAKLAYRPLSLLTPKTIPKTGKYSLSAKLYTKYLHQKWEKMRPLSFSWKDYYRVHNSYWKSTSSCIQCRQFSKRETCLILKSAKQMGVSVNSYIVTAFLQADSRNRIVGIPVSVRESENKSMANLTSGIRITHSFAKDRSFAKNARQIQEKIAKKIKDHRWFVLRFLADLPPAFMDGALLFTHHCYDDPIMEQLAGVMGYHGKAMRDLGITNLTVIDLPVCYGSVKIENIIFVPPNISYSHNVIGVSTFQGKMTVTYHGTEDGREEQKQFFDRGIKNLLSQISL